ncbi:MULTISPECIES: LacI family DNA-binding transcriptional regulator [Rathayibacter]|uniref:LacI family DNA-binding transcriptional regulator n=1 Tax=Rathayibacter TaxID=33886 RepID=UPI001356D01F|nr:MULTISPECIES: LacI family DNA-binding transcriptional regulator [Rathayibacter]
MPRSTGNRKPPTTIYDIAVAAGVSPSTVSRALTKPGRININTEKRIRAVAADLDYRTNPMARALPTGRTGTLALLLSDITNPVYFDLIRAAERVTSSQSHILVLAESQESPELELQTAHRLQPSVDGIVLVASRLQDNQIRELADIKPIVVVNRTVAGVPSLVPDARPGLEAAVLHLKSLGHRSFCYVSGPTTSWMNSLRWQTLFDLAVAEGMSVVDIGPGAPTMEGGAELLPRILASGATAMLAYNDLMAIGLLRACQDRGISVPGRISIIGFDDIFGADLPTPALSTIRSPLGELGETAVRLLTADHDGGDASHRPPTVFISRDSTSSPD